VLNNRILAGDRRSRNPGAAMALDLGDQVRIADEACRAASAVADRSGDRVRVRVDDHGQLAHESTSGSDRVVMRSSVASGASARVNGRTDIDP